MRTRADYPDLFAQLHSQSGSSLQPTAISFRTSVKLLWNFCDFGLEEHGSFNSNRSRRIFGHFSGIPLVG
jgi:hypothetical protein